ncbi:MAG: rhodanese-like domain-containing protein [Reichenbachiella sp.]
MKSSIRPLGIITVSIFGFLIILTLFNNNSNFKLTAQEMHAKVILTNYMLDSAGIAEKENMIFVDLREPQEYLISHQKEAINIPMSSLLEEQFQPIWGNNYPKVLYANSPIKGHEAWMLLTQMGVEKLFVSE